jgi:hypothetical protein
MRTLSITVFLASTLAAAISACTPYDPDLGGAPFFCGPADAEKRCPDGYTCQPSAGSGGTEVCLAPNGTVPVDGQNGSCADDRSLEPNDSTATAWITPVDTTKSFPLSSLAICPAGDKDNYSVMISIGTENLEMIVEWEPGGAELQGAILNSGGVAIANATATVANTKRAYTPNLPAGIYYVQVYGPNQGSLTTNNYKLNINVTGP